MSLSTERIGRLCLSPRRSNAEDAGTRFWRTLVHSSKRLSAPCKRLVSKRLVKGGVARGRRPGSQVKQNQERTHLANTIGPDSRGGLE